MLRARGSNGACMLRHCCLGHCFQPVFFSLSLVWDRDKAVCFICNILPVLPCTCTDSNSSR